MKKIIISLVALAAIAGAASAERRSYELRDLQTLNGHSSDGAFLPPFVSGAAVDRLTNKEPVIDMIDNTGEHQNSPI